MKDDLYLVPHKPDIHKDNFRIVFAVQRFDFYKCKGLLKSLQL